MQENDPPSAHTEESTEEEFDGSRHSSLSARHQVLGETRFTKFHLLIGGCGLVLFILVIAFLFGNQGTTNPDAIDALYNRIEQLENRLADAEALAETVMLMEEQGKRIDLFMNETERSHAKLNLRLELIEKRLGGVATPSSTPKAKPRTTAPRKPAAAASSPPKQGSSYHVVRKGDTLYSISRRHGLTVKEIRNLNPDARNKPIYPGQKLKVK